MSDEKITGIILCGGKSSRFKSPKHQAKINDKTLLEIALEKLRSLCDEVIVVSKEPIKMARGQTCPPMPNGIIGLGRRGQEARKTRNQSKSLSLRGAPKYARAHNFRATWQSSIKNVIEKNKGYHPLIGITEGLKASSNDANLIVACDMPFVNKKMLAPLLKSKADISVYRYKGKAEPLLGMYRKSCLQNIADFRDRRIIDVIEDCDFKYVDEENDNLAFMNINTKEDLDVARKIARDNPEILSN